MQRRPIRTQRNRSDERDPERRYESSAPQGALKRRKIAAAAREPSAIAQRLDEAGVFENGKLLPEQNTNEKPAEHPSLQNEQSQREKHQQQRRRARKSDPRNDQAKDHQQSENAI